MPRIVSILLVALPALAGLGIMSARPAAHQLLHARPVARDSTPGPTDIYANVHAGELSAIARTARPLVYVPNSRSNTVTVIDPARYAVVTTFATGKLPQHVVPAYDMTRLWVLNDVGNSLTPIDPRTGAPGPRVAVDDPYNLYFTPDGRYAMVVAERLQRLDFRDAHTMRLTRSVPVTCRGLDHVEFTADDRYAIATCEFSGKLAKFDLQTQSVVGYLQLNTRGRHRSMPQDIRSSPDGRVFYVADMMVDGVHTVDPAAFRETGFIATGKGTHGLTPSRDGSLLYVANRGSNRPGGPPHGPGSVTVLESRTGRIVGRWSIPGGGSPDMGNVSADGRELWLSGRYDREVYVFDTKTGALEHRIPVGREPHGLCVWPQPGRYSLGHTGNMR